jgi:YD repeat-containing protein
VNRPANLRSGDPPYFETRYLHDANARAGDHARTGTTRRVYELEVDPAAPRTTQGNLRELWLLPGTHVPAGDQPGGVVQRYEYFGGFGGCCGTSFVSRHTAARGNVTEHDYDAFGNRIETRHRAGGGVEDWTYDAFGCETSHTLADDGSGYRRRDERHWYGPADGAQNGYLREEVVDAANLALATRYAYDAVGNATSVTDPRGNDTQFLYNALNEVVRKRSRQLSGSPSFRIDTLTSYDANDNVTRVDVENRNELGTLDAANPAIRTERDYGILNEVLRERREVAADLFVTTEFAYDANRNRTLVRKGEAFAGRQPANIVETRYDERDLVWRELRASGDPSQSTDQRDYDGTGTSSPATRAEAVSTSRPTRTTASTARARDGSDGEHDGEPLRPERQPGGAHRERRFAAAPVRGPDPGRAARRRRIGGERPAERDDVRVRRDGPADPGGRAALRHADAAPDPRRAVDDDPGLRSKLGPALALRRRRGARHRLRVRHREPALPVHRCEGKHDHDDLRPQRERDHGRRE